MGNKTKVLLSGTITAVLVFFLLTQFNALKTVELISNISPACIALAAAIYFLITLSKALRFRLLLGPDLKVTGLFKIASIHTLFINLLPSRTGELSGLYLLRKHNVSLASATSALVASRVFDFFALSGIFFAVVLLLPELPELISRAIFLVALLVFMLFFIVLLILYFGEKVVFLLIKFFPKTGLREKLGNLLLEVVHAFRVIKSKDILFSVFLVSVVRWLLLISFIFVVLQGMMVDVTLLIVSIATSFLKLLDFIPVQGLAGFGTVEGFYSIVYISLGMGKQTALASGFAYHLLLLAYSIVFGLFCIFLERKKVF